MSVAMYEIKDMQDDRGKALAAARAINDLANKEKRGLTDEETKNYDKAFNEAAELKASIERETKLRDEERELVATVVPDVKAVDPKNGGHQPTNAERVNAVFCKLLTAPYIEAAAMPDFKLFNALQQDSDTAGGFTVPPQFIAGLIKAIDDLTFMRRLSRVIPVTVAESLGAVSLDNDPEDADWTAEVVAADEDTAMDFGKREFVPTPVSKLLKVSKKLLRSSALPIDALVRDRLAYKFAITQEKAFLNGTGAKQPLGVFTASDDGIGTARDLSTDNSTTAIAADNLKRQKYNIKAGYRGKAQWLFHRDGVSQVSRLKDGNGQYLWREGLAAGDPDRLLNMPVNESEYAPNTFTTGLYVGILGDFSNYWIADSLSMQIQVLMELYAVTNQNGYIGRMETDGMPVLAEAFTRVKLT